eukprot:scaffold158082_cov30-Tisochrysis_lutea.AAC.1
MRRVVLLLSFLLCLRCCTGRLLTLRGYEVDSGNLLAPRPARSLDATWGEALSLAGQTAIFSAKYNSEADQAMLSEIRLSGTLPTASEGLELAYDVAHRFRLRQTAYRLRTSLKELGAKVTAATPFIPGGPPALICDGPSITEIELERSIGAVEVRSVFLVQESVLRLTAATEFGGGQISTNVHVPFGPKKGPDIDAEVGLIALVNTGRRIRTSLTNRNRAVIEMIDAQSERGAVWVATACFPISMQMLEAPRRNISLVIRRRWGAK